VLDAELLELLDVSLLVLEALDESLLADELDEPAVVDELPPRLSVL
jgi:hypothetical protein